ncbi:MAG: hypothetical protein ACOYOT_03400 [Bacteroidales bacterium]
MTDFEEILKALNDRFNEIKFTIQSLNNRVQLTFQSQYQIDYYYSVDISNELRFISIGVVLKNQPNNLYFWSTGMEFSNASDFETIGKEYLFEQLEILIGNRTQIIQKKSVFAQTFTLEYYKDGVWKVLDKNNAFRFSNFIFPKIDKKIEIYR